MKNIEGKKSVNSLESLKKQFLSNQENGKWIVKLTKLDQINETSRCFEEPTFLAYDFEDIVTEKESEEFNDYEITQLIDLALI